jgi:two-component system NtrC family sensor kinase
MKGVSSPRKQTSQSILASHYLLPVAAAALILILCSALYIVYTDTNFIRETINQDFNQQQLILARQASTQLGNILDDETAELERLGNLLSSTGKPQDFADYMRSTLNFSQGAGLIEIGLVGQDGKIIEVVNVYGLSAGERATHIPVQQLQEARQMELGPLHMGLDSTLMTGFLCSRLRHPTIGEATLYIQLDVTRLVRGVTQGIRSGETGSAWVIDENGVFLYHTEREFVGKNAFTARQEREPYVSFNKINNIMQDRMLQGEDGTGNYISGWHRGIKGEVTKLLAFSPVKTSSLVPGRLWSVAVSAPIAEISKAVDQVRERHLLIEIAMIASMFGFVLLVAIYQRRASRALKEKVSEQQEYLSAIMQDSVDAIIFIDNKNQVKVWNKGAEMIFGYTAEEMLGSRFRRLVPPDLEADRELGRIMEEVYEKGHIKNYQTQRLTKSGKRITVNISRTLIHNEDGEPIGSTAIIKDVTDKVDMDKHIYNTEKLASIGTLAAGVAHEINNPLSVILGFVDLLKEHFEEGAQELDDLKMIEENANRAKMIVENLLSFARVTEGMEKYADVSTALTTVVNVARNTLMTKKIELSTDIREDLPPIVGDSREFQQVIFNLINNATAAMSAEGGKLTITAYPDNDWVRIKVSDTGSGIPDSVKGQIFDPFFTTKKVGQGTGLGLSLCYGIVKKYGGSMEFASVSKDDRPNEASYTTFTVSMPVYRPKVAEEGSDR